MSYRGYQKLIHEIVPAYNPRHIEAYMRIVHGTLDNLSRKQFANEVKICAIAVDMAGPEDSEELAKSFGI